MTRLEARGFEAVAREWLEVYAGPARLLTILLQAAPNVPGWERLGAGLSGIGKVNERASVGVYLHQLRTALDEVGFHNAIETVRGEGPRFIGDAAALRAEIEARA